MTDMDAGRRVFLKLTVAAGGGLLIGFDLAACSPTGASYRLGGDIFSPNSWIHLAPAPVNSDFNNSLTGQQMTGGSTAVRGYWELLRRVGATTRELLIAAAAQSWGVAPDQCRARGSEVMQDASGRRIHYGALLAQAAKLTPPQDVRLKDPKDFRLIGTSVARLDTPAKVDGSAVFGQDVRVPGMLTAAVARCPVFGGGVKSYDATAARAVAGVRHVVAIGSGIAVVADNFWAAQRGREALVIQWEFGSKAKLDSAAIAAQLRAAVGRAGKTARDEGDASKALTVATRVVEALYETPYLAHACMEPMNCTAHVRADGCDVWVPTQAQTETQATAAKISGLSKSAVRVHTTFVGGGFGRRLPFLDQVVPMLIESPFRVQSDSMSPSVTVKV